MFITEKKKKILADWFTLNVFTTDDWSVLFVFWVLEVFYFFICAILFVAKFESSYPSRLCFMGIIFLGSIEMSRWVEIYCVTIIINFKIFVINLKKIDRMCQLLITPVSSVYWPTFSFKVKDMIMTAN